MIKNTPRLIATAIRYRRRLIVRCTGQPHAHVIEPHILFRAPDGMIGLIAYQVRGSEEHGTELRRGTFWRPFVLEGIERIYVAEDTFTPRFRQGYTTVKTLLRGDVLAQVDTRHHENNFLDKPPSARGVPADRVLTTQGLSAQDSLPAG